MSTLRDPVGPKGRNVYIRRRILVLAGLIAIIAVIVLVVVKPGANGGARDAAQVEVPGDIAGEDGDASDAAKADSDQPPNCAAGQLKVTPLTDKESYAAGEQPQLSLSVENTGDEACAADVGTAGMEFSITSGDDQVWRSKDCLENAESLNVVLEPGKALTTETLPWDRTRSSQETCDITRDPVASGGASYHLRAKVAGVESADTAQFLLL